MENTCRKEKCPMWGLFNDPEEPCINYVQSWWEDKQTGENKLVCDCVPKRTFIMLQHIMNRMDGVQQASEEERNKSNKLLKEVEKVYRMVLFDNSTTSTSFGKLINKDKVQQIEIEKIKLLKNEEK